MAQLVYTEEELFTEHDYAEPQVSNGQRLHGGFLADGTYVPPRSLGRTEALEHWAAALEARGGSPLDADSSLLGGERMPNLEQHRLLLRNGIGGSFWNMLTITGKIEAKGRLLADIQFPDFQDAIVDDISEMAIGHLNKGLLVAHGLDEGGLPDQGIGGHDAMWFAARDLALGVDAYPDVEPPESIGRPDTGDRRLPEIEPQFEGLLSFLMNLLIIEFRAEIGFKLTQDVLCTPDLWTDRDPADITEADALIERIRTDELVHVSSLRLYLGELRSVQFRNVEGGTISGAELIDRLWDGLVHWASVEQPALVADQQREDMAAFIRSQPDGDRVLGEFEALSDRAKASA